MSLLCNALLKESYKKHDVNSPADALGFVREKLVSLFRAKQESYISDGMDVAFCALNREAGHLYFAGANNNCLRIRKGEVSEFKGDRQSVGFSDRKMPFNAQVIEVEKGDQIYIYSDGYIDQFGGPNNRKFMKKKLHELLSRISEKNMDEQEQILKWEFEAWKGENEQTDDVTLMGVRL